MRVAIMVLRWYFICRNCKRQSCTISTSSCYEKPVWWISWLLWVLSKTLSLSIQWNSVTRSQDEREERLNNRERKEMRKTFWREGKDVYVKEWARDTVEKLLLFLYQRYEFSRTVFCNNFPFCTLLSTYKEK